MIADDDLQTEIQTDPLIIGYAGAGANPLAAMMNKAGSASSQVYVVSSIAMPLNKDKFLQKIEGLDESANLNRLLVSGTDLGDALDFKLNQSVDIDMTRAANIGLVDLMTALDDISTIQQPLKTATRDKILMLGKVLQSRSQELWGEAVSVEQIKGVL